MTTQPSPARKVETAEHTPYSRLCRWRDVGDTYVAGGKEHADDVIALLAAYDDMLAALQRIASCEKHLDGDVVDIARKAYAKAIGAAP